MVGRATPNPRQHRPWGRLPSCALALAVAAVALYAGLESRRAFVAHARPKKEDGAVSRVILRVTAANADRRKLRSAIESIVRDQEDLRLAAPLVSGRTLFSAGSVIGITGLSGIVSFLPLVATVALPVLASAVFVYASVAESSGARSKGLARYNSAQAIVLAAQQENVLSQAEVYKAFIPFGVGLTAIFAAACVAFKVFNETLEKSGLENVPTPLLVADDFIIVCLALAALIGAVVTNDKWVCMSTALTLGPEELEDMDQNEWEILRLPNNTRLPQDSSRVLVGLGTVLLCILPLPFIVEGLFSWEAEKGLELLKEQEILDLVSVVVSACAGAQAAIILLFAEKEFSDAERRIAIQCKQAALAELFYAQAMAEAAVMPASTALAGAAFASMNVAVEFTILGALQTIWPGAFTAIRSTLSSVMARVEANASWLELQVSRKGRVGRRRTDAVASVTREIKLLQSDFRLDGFSNDVRRSLEVLSIGDLREFKLLDKHRRRKVHLIAAELGMMSQSVGSMEQRVVSVTNMGWRTEDQDQKDTAVEQFEEIWKGVQDEARATIDQGVPKDSQNFAIVAAVATAGSLTSPFTAGLTGAELVIPLVTGGVGLAAVMQEFVGKEAVALAKQKASNMMRYQAESEAYIGRAMMAYAALPTDFALVTFATTLSLFGPAAAEYTGVGQIAWLASPVALIMAVAVRILSVRRLARLEDCVQNIVSRVQAETKLEKIYLHAGRRWLVPVGLAFMVPCSVPWRATMACAVLMAEVGMVMAAAATRLASGEFFAHRAGRNFARAEAWTQRSQNSIRFLPVESAAAVVSTLLATALSTFSLPASAIFGAVTFSVWVRAVQFSTQARNDAKMVGKETQDWQKLPTLNEDPDSEAPWRYTQREYGEANQPPDPALWMMQGTLPTGNSVAVEGAAARIAARKSRFDVLKALGRSAKRFVRIWDDRGPEELYAASPAELAVQSVQSDLDEIRVSVRTTERSWFRTLSAVGLCAAAALLAPVVLSELATEVILPVAGAGLTIFAVQAESEARRSISLSKVWAAELSSVVHTMEELLSTACIYRARLMSGTAVTAMVGVFALACHHPWGGHHAVEGVVQKAFRWGLVLFNVGAAAWCVRPLRGVWRWTDHVRSIDQPLLRNGGPRFAPRPDKVLDLNDANTKAAEGAWKDAFEGKALKRRKLFRIAFLTLASMPALLIAIVPWTPHFSHRAVASTAAGACVVASSLWLAERSLAQSERLVAGRLRTFALTDAFSNEAEQQGALLPVASAAAIAIAGLITFGTELNPSIASILAIFQAATWALASRRGVKTRFESDAALQVASVTEAGPRQNFGMRESRSSDFLRSLRKWALRA